MGRRLTLIAGSGTLAKLVAEEATARGGPVQLIDLVGRGDLAADIVTQIPVARASEIVDAVHRFRTDDLVVAGGVPLTDSDRAAMISALGLSGRLVRSLGDRALALSFLLHFRLAGVRVLGAHQLIPGLLAPEGRIAGPAVAAAARASALRALTAAREVGRLDLGQAVVTSGDRPVVAEDVGGTDALLARVSALRSSLLRGEGTGPLILAKSLKPGQPKFVDLPTIGPDTIIRAADAGVTMVVVEAGRSLVVERARLAAEAEGRGVSVIGMRLARG